MKLYTFFRGSSPFRVRIALNLKGLAYESSSVHLAKGEQRQPAYSAVNPQSLVPALVLDDGQVLTQSLAIIEYLDETHPEPALLPGAPADRARIRAIAQTIACDIHPINNLRVLQYLTRELGVSDEQKNAWYRHWIETGLGAVEAMLGDPRTGAFCHGDTPTLADCCLVPQVFNAQSYECDLAPYPTSMRIFDACMQLDAFASTQPMKQADAVA